jgi:hypothetical protein
MVKHSILPGFKSIENEAVAECINVDIDIADRRRASFRLPLMLLLQRCALIAVLVGLVVMVMVMVMIEYGIMG